MTSTTFTGLVTTTVPVLKIERVSTRLVVVVVVVVAQPHMHAYACAHASSVTEPKSHRSLPKRLPLHTEESLEKGHPATNFTNQSLAAEVDEKLQSCGKQSS